MSKEKNLYWKVKLLGDIVSYKLSYFIGYLTPF